VTVPLIFHSIFNKAPCSTRGAHAAQALAPRERLRCANCRVSSAIAPKPTRLRSISYGAVASPSRNAGYSGEGE